MSSVTLGPEVKDLTLMEMSHRVTISEYHKMAETGVFGPSARIELLRGVLVDKMTKKQPHIIATEILEILLHRIIPEGWYPTISNPMTILDGDSEPEPDAQILRGTPRDYQGRRHGPGDAALVIEVSDTSFAIDRRQKWSIFGEAGVPVYWIVDLYSRRLLVFTDPTGPTAEPGYRTERAFGPDDEAPIVLDGREVARIFVRDILP